MEMPGRDLLLYLAEFESSDGVAIDPLELEALPVSASANPPGKDTPVAGNEAGAGTGGMKKEERPDESE